MPPECPEGWTVGAPDFVICGTPKSGTTRWRSLIAAHPDVHMAAQELHFFDDIAGRWIDPDDIALYHQFFPRPQGGIAGEKTPAYLSFFWMARMLVEAAPDTKLIVSLRDPVDRYLSARMFAERTRERALADGVKPGRFERDTVVQCFERGEYARHMRWLFATFPPDRIMVLQFEACLAEPHEQLRRTYEYLGLAPFEPGPEHFERQVNPTQKSPLGETEPERLALIRELYRPDVLQLKELVPELDLSLWRNFADLAS